MEEKEVSDKQVYVHKNQDEKMLPFIIENLGPNTIEFHSYLEKEKWWLHENKENELIICPPNTRWIIPHQYYQPVVPVGEAKLNVRSGIQAPELKNFKMMYAEKLMIKDPSRLIQN